MIREVNDAASRQRRGLRLGRLAALSVLGVVINYPWELAQSSLYIHSGQGPMWWHCLVASLGDGLALLGIFALGCSIFRRWMWFRPGEPRSYFVVFASGLAIGLALEWWAVHVSGRWKYAPGMPLVPWLHLGFIPLLQMIVLPPLAFHMAFGLRTRNKEDERL